MDFSEGERSGFIDAFVQFWTMRTDNTRAVEELNEAAKAVLRGCEEHFRAAVTKVSRINGAVGPDKVAAFKARALGLLSVPGIEEFNKQANLIIRDFPKLKAWMEWWMRPSHATMLFSSQRLMEEHIVESIPNTTNAKEAMHWRFYSAAGRDHSFMHGMMSLYKIAVDFERQFEAVNSTYLPVSILPGTNFKLLLEGIPIRYRRPEAWKVTAAEIGRTKPTRTAKPGEKKRKKNDGRPPDTIKELFKPIKGTKKKPAKKVVFEVSDESEEAVTKEPAKGSKKKPIKETDIETKKQAPTKLTKNPIFGPPSYRWKHNSCWLDTPLELLYVALMRNFEESSAVLDALDEDSPLRVILKSMESRRHLSTNPDDVKTSVELSKQHDEIRQHLFELGIIDDLKGFNSVFVSNWTDQN
jgi:hypothetical protein